MKLYVAEEEIEKSVRACFSTAGYERSKSSALHIQKTEFHIVTAWWKKLYN